MEFDAFLSYHSADQDQVRELRRRLRVQGLRVWLDTDDLRPGERWQDGLETAILASASVLVCLGGSGVGPWENEEMQAALDLATRDPRPVIPVLLPGAPERPALSLFLKNRSWVDLRGGIDSAGISRLVWGITGTRTGEGPTPANPRDQLPADLPDFTGRAADRDWLEARLTPGPPPPSARSRARAASARPRSPSTAPIACASASRTAASSSPWAVSASGHSTPSKPWPGSSASSSPNCASPRPHAVQAIYRRILQGRRVLILADDAASAAQVAPLAPRPPAALLITSRRRIALGAEVGAGPGAVRDLDLLEPPEARALLAGILEETRPATPADLDRLAAGCGRLPLALRVAGAQLALHPEAPLDDYLAEVEDAATRLAALQCDGLAQGRVGAVLALSADRLLAESPLLAARWQALACFPAPFDRAAAAVWGLPEPRAQRPLSDLIDRSLLCWDPGPARYRLHDLLRPIAAAPWDWCRGPLGPDGPAPERLDEALARHAAHFLGVLRAAQQRYLEGHDGVTAGLAAYDADAAQITAGQAWAAAGAAEAAARLAQDYPHAGVYVLYLRLHPRERVRWLESGLAAARRLGERGAEGAHLGNLGVAWADLGEPRKAIGLRAAALHRPRDRRPPRRGDRLLQPR